MQAQQRCGIFMRNKWTLRSGALFFEVVDRAALRGTMVFNGTVEEMKGLVYEPHSLWR